MNGISFHGLTDRGNKRRTNEDRLWVPSRKTHCPSSASAWGKLFIVADGMGGYGAGDVASKLAVEIVSQVYYSHDVPYRTPQARLEAAIQAAHKAIVQDSRTSPAKARMGTTIIAVVIKHRRLWIAWVGDSRAYRLRDGKLTQLTEDHSVLWERIRSGEITWDDLHFHPRRSRLTNSLSALRKQVIVSHWHGELQEGDQLLLCSDGLTSEVNDEEIGRILIAHRPEESTDLLLQAAKREKTWRKDGRKIYSHGGDDNITSIVIHMPGVTLAATSLFVRLIRAVAAAVLILLISVAIAYFLLGGRL